MEEIKLDKNKKIKRLTKSLIVACKIYEFNIIKKDKIWFSKLVESLKHKASPHEILRDLNLLSDWGIVKSQYGETSKGRAGRLYYISSESKDFIKKIYEQYYIKDG